MSATAVLPPASGTNTIDPVRSGSPLKVTFPLTGATCARPSEEPQPASAQTIAAADSRVTRGRNIFETPLNEEELAATAKHVSSVAERQGSPHRPTPRDGPVRNGQRATRTLRPLRLWREFRAT